MSGIDLAPAGFVESRPPPGLGQEARAPRVVAIGNSHLEALRTAVKTQSPQQPHGFQAYFLSAFDPPYQPFWSLENNRWAPHAQFQTDAAALMRGIKPDLVVAFVAGLFQFAYGTYEDVRPFDFHFPQAPQLRVVAGREIIPYDLVLESALASNQLWPPLLKLIVGWAAPTPVLSICPPPPIADFTPFYARVKEKADVSGFQPGSVRSKMWRVQVIAERAHAQALGAGFLDLPPQAETEAGLLGAEYAHDELHANVNFGRLLARQIEGALARRDIAEI